MSLKKYISKRNLSKTPEPSGKKTSKSGVLLYVIQKHAASHLHYDLRLELDGVLKSWAVPKGPSMDPSVKRLAIHVEDHPYDYGSFEGTIPAGNYGAGKVIIWDKGTYDVPGDTKKEKEKAAREMLEKGDFKFTLYGKKLKGSFALVRMRGSDSKQWLLIKKHDEYESPDDVTTQTKSVVSDESIGNDLSKAPKSTMPKKKVKPMLAYLVDKPFDDKNWIYEVKWDGYRAIAEIEARNVELYSRNFLSFKEKFPSIVKSLEKLPGSIILDGEVVVLDKEGRSQFQLLQNYLHSPDAKSALKYCIFDILYYKGRDLRKLPLIERKEILKDMLQKNPSSNLYYSDYIKEKGIAFYEQAGKKNLEGIMAKDAKSPYLSVRSKSWLKIKIHQNQEVVIGGFTAPRNSREHFGSLLVGVYKGEMLMYAGHVGGGFNRQLLKEAYDKLEPMITTKCPFSKTPKVNAKETWVKPKLVCEVSFQEWTKDGIMRQPIFQGFRIDKDVKKVSKETAVKKEAVKKTKEESKDLPKESNALGEIITHPNKVLWPEDGYTKHDLLEYYQGVSQYILPHLKERPIVMHRYPNGIQGEGFYHKEAPDFIPPWIRTVNVEHSDKTIPYILIPNVQSLLYVVNLGSIEIHPFLSKYTDIDKPVALVIDIDPVSLPFESAVEVAKETQKILAKLKVEAYCKTSGKRGLHIYLPLDAKYEFADVENFAKLLAYYIHTQLPEITSLVRDPAKRQKKVYLDYLQNGYSKMVVAPYSVRPLDGAPVSAPLEWKEVKKGLDPKDFNIKTMIPRLKKKGDLFKGVLGKGIDMKKILKILEKLTSKDKGQ